MAETFVSEPITPLEGSFDPSGMARGEPGLPLRFRWRKHEWTVAEVLETWKEYGDCTHGSGERYLRQHGYRIRTSNGWILKVYFQRTSGKSKTGRTPRWWIQRNEKAPETTPEKGDRSGGTPDPLP